MWVIAASLFVVSIVLSFAFLIDKVTVSASSIALTEQGWKANFSSPLKDSAIQDGDIFIVDQQGNKTDADINLHQNGHSIEVTGMKPGSYKLQVNKEAVIAGYFKSMSTNQLSFTVHDELQSVKSEKELKDYFITLRKMFNQRFSHVEESTTESSADSSNKSSGTGGGEYSQTNNQVEGVDEADLVKTDGEYIYSIMNGRVVITDIRKPSAMLKVAEIQQEETFYPMQLFLNGDTLIVLGDKQTQHELPDVSSSNSDRIMLPHMGYTSSTNVRFYDVKDAKNPKLVREIGTEGYLNGARKTDNMLYFVTNVAPNYWMLEEGGDVGLRPHTFDSKKSDKASPMSYSDISILPGTLEGTYSVITAMDLNNPKESQVVTKGYLGGSQAMYMSKETLYLTAPIYMPRTQNNNKMSSTMWNPQAANTEIFKFKLNGTAVDFVSSGEVTGMLLNQFSMDEHKGYFRVVTTKGFAWNNEEPSENNLFILDAGMKQVGSIEGLAEGERIYSARFMGDKAYMVTFRETDPLFVMDVSNPTSPKVLGELKIPGFSNYLHPLDENHLIGFGYDTKSMPNENGSEPRIITGGMKISLFDITDFSNPKEKDVEILGGQGTYSALQHDHKALFQHREKGYYGFPVTLYDGSNQEGYGEFSGEGAIVYKITAEEGIEQVGNMINKQNSTQTHENWENSVQRMLYVRDSLYTISMKEIKSYDLNTFKETGIVTY
ncbi:beta-propeller domain-containing protein [Paenisporosarcina sp. TG20]|uniref:beta-propeller domain-containing protein n=1 Tax=Paenisporosarcina sp. TG20 TaxID=1211706 RepID=UPI0003133CA9|nr:beta-propeller domain-containing protein [Paenisporosarcina sp. TG20]